MVYLWSILSVMIINQIKDTEGYQRDKDSSPNLSELSSSSVTLFFHWSKAKGNGNGGRLSSCLMVWEAASDWSKPYFSSTTHGGKRKLPEVAWSCTRLEENLLITCCVFKVGTGSVQVGCLFQTPWGKVQDTGGKKQLRVTAAHTCVELNSRSDLSVVNQKVTLISCSK